jgi:hypothetical protein
MIKILLLLLLLLLELCKKPCNQPIIGMIADASLSIDYLTTYPSA